MGQLRKGEVYMELTQLYYFYVTAQHEHVTKAAEELNVAQPALTQAIHRLEKELGVPLFEHKGRNIVLNLYGKLVQKRLSTVFSVLGNLPREIDALSGIEKRTIRVNILAASTIVTDIIITYKKLHPETNFQLMQNEESREADICISTTAGHWEEGGEDVRDIVFTEEIFLAVPMGSRYHDRNSVYLEEVSDEDFISLAGSRPLRAICDKFCMEAGFVPKVIFESDSPATVRELIGAGLGIGFWPAYSWGTIEGSSIALVPVVSPQCKRNIIVTCSRFLAESPGLLDFYHFMLDYIHDLGHKNPFEIQHNAQ